MPNISCPKLKGKPVVATLVNEDKTPGNYEVKFDGNNLSSGIYFYIIKAGKFSAIRKMNLIK